MIIDVNNDVCEISTGDRTFLNCLSKLKKISLIKKKLQIIDMSYQNQLSYIPQYNNNLQPVGIQFTNPIMQYQNIAPLADGSNQQMQYETQELNLRQYIAGKQPIIRGNIQYNPMDQYGGRAVFMPDFAYPRA